MDSILTDLWYGNVTPCDSCGVGDVEVERLEKAWVNKKTHCIVHCRSHKRKYSSDT